MPRALSIKGADALFFTSAADSCRTEAVKSEVFTPRSTGEPTAQARANVTPGEEIENGYIKQNDEGSRYQRIR